MCVCHQFTVLRKKKNGNENLKKEKENENEKCYFFLLAFFEEKVDISLEKLVGAIAGFETPASRFVRELACDSFETGFLDGMLRLFLEPETPCSFGALCGNFALSAGAVEKDAPPSPTTV